LQSSHRFLKPSLPITPQHPLDAIYRCPKLAYPALPLFNPVSPHTMHLLQVQGSGGVPSNACNRAET